MHLTGKEQQVAKLVCAGYTNHEISEMLLITEHTIKAHVSSILGKLGAKNRTELAYLLGLKQANEINKNQEHNNLNK